MGQKTAGLLFYITPTLRFLIGLLVYREAVQALELAAFALIWCGLVIFVSTR